MKDPDQGMDAYCSPPMRYARELCQLYATAQRPLVFVGPVGAGKTTLAREAHRLSHRTGEFVTVSAGELTEALFADALFGRVTGAYTGASTDRVGAIGRAKGGTLLIDDLAVMPHVVQISLLRVLESGRYRPLGTDENRAATCQLMFATTSELESLESDGVLIRDLASRLGELIIPIPPLVQRRQDIMLMARHCADAYLRERRVEGTVTFSDEASDLLQEYEWPKNARELRAVVERAVIHAGIMEESIVVRPAHLPERIRTFESGGTDRVDLTLELVRSAVKRAGGNQCEAARQLGCHRNTIARYLDQSG